MEVLECIKVRRSVRSYKSDQIPGDLVEKLKEALRLAPSAANRQPWKFILVEDEGLRRQMVEKCNGQGFLAEAPLVIVGCGNPEEAWHGVGGDPEHDTVDIDLAIAIDHLTLAAASLGLGTCWVCAFREPCFKKLLGIPEEWRIVALTPVGYPKEANAFHPPEAGKRKKTAQIFCKDGFK